MSHRRHATVLVLGLALAGLAACDREDPIRTYDAPKEKPQQPSAPQAVAEATPITVPGAILTPAKDWKLAPPASMRLATFIAGPAGATAEVQVSSMPVHTFTRDPDGNINRWRGQIALPPVGNASAATPAQAVTVGGGKAALYDFSNTQNGRRLIVTMAQRGEMNWYIKILGPATTVTDQKAAFDAFLQSVRFE